jgi:hypothetical protein
MQLTLSEQRFIDLKKQLISLPENSPEIYDKSIELAYLFDNLTDEYIAAKEQVDEMIHDLIMTDKTVAAAEKEIAITEIGKQAFRLKMKLKSLEKLLSQLKDKKRNLTSQTFNQY